MTQKALKWKYVISAVLGSIVHEEIVHQLLGEKHKTEEYKYALSKTGMRWLAFSIYYSQSSVC